MTDWVSLTSDGDTAVLLNNGELEEWFEVYFEKESVFLYMLEGNGKYTELKIPRTVFEDFLRELNAIVFPYENEISISQS